MSLNYRRGPIRRALHRMSHEFAHRLGPVCGAILTSRPALLVLSFTPVPPTRFMRALRSPSRPWSASRTDVPDELTTVPGIGRDQAAEEAAFLEHPLHEFFALHAEAFPVVLRRIAPTIVTAGPWLFSATRRLKMAQNRPPKVSPGADVDPAALTAELKAEARRLGISGAGVAAFDPKYTFAEFEGLAVGDRVVVCALEQNYDATQRIPSLKSERAAVSTYGELEDKLLALAEWLRARGYRARPETFSGESLVIHYGVAAGLGQLGMNGQLLTPQAGSRCRLNVLTTDAPLVFDKPVDYGIEGICDVCQICVRRCPVGAIPKQRKEYRGITKAKLNTKRCLPVIMASEGCAICMKVCPIQRFGLDAVMEEYQRTGAILGKGTDDLEGYDWALDGRHYGPGERPRLPIEVTSPKDLTFDATRVEPKPGSVVGTTLL